MRKHLSPWIVALIISLVFFGTAGVCSYWMISGAAWWLRDLSSLLLFVEGALIFLRGTTSTRATETSWRMAHLLSALLQPFGFSVVPVDYLHDLEQIQHSLPVVAEQTESEVSR